VLPYLAEINPRISKRLRNLAEVVRADYRLLQEFVSVAHDTLQVASYPDAVVFDLVRWREQPLAVQRAMVRRSAYRLRHTLRDVDFDHIEHAVDVAQAGTDRSTSRSAARSQADRRVYHAHDWRRLCMASPRRASLAGRQTLLSASQLPGTTPLPGGWTLEAKELTSVEYGCDSR
jgi:hypothetical protein